MQAKPAVRPAVKAPSSGQNAKTSLVVAFKEEDREQDGIVQALATLRINPNIEKLAVNNLSSELQARNLMSIIKSKLKLKSLFFKNISIDDAIFKIIAESILEHPGIEELVFGNPFKADEAAKSISEESKEAPGSEQDDSTKQITKQSLDLIEAIIRRDKLVIFALSEDMLSAQFDVMPLSNCVAMSKNLRIIRMGARDHDLQEIMHIKKTLKRINDKTNPATEVCVNFRFSRCSEINQLNKVTCEAMKKSATIAKLTIILSRLAKVYERTLSEIANVKSLQTLEVTESDVDDSLFTVLADKLCASDNTITHFTISAKYSSKAKITVQSMPAIIRLIQKDVLKVLVLTEQVVDLPDHLDELLLACAKSTQLEMIQVGKHILDSYVINQIRFYQRALCALDKPPEVTIMRESREPQFLAHVLSILRQSHRLEIMHAGGGFGMDSCNRKIIVPLGDENAIKLLDALQPHQHLQYLDLSNNGLTNSIMVKLIQFLTTHEIVELNLSGNRFTEEAIIQLSKFINTDSKLVKLDLAECSLGSAGALSLAKAVANNKTLTTLNLTACLLESASLSNFTDSISKNGSLLILNMPKEKESASSEQQSASRGFYPSSYQRNNAHMQTPKQPKWVTANIKNKDEAVLATMGGHTADLKSLLGKRVSPYVRGEGENTLLHLSVKNKHLPIIKYFLLELRVNPRLRNSANQTAQDIAQEIATKENDRRILDCFSQSTNPPKGAHQQTKISALFESSAQKRPLNIPLTPPKITDAPRQMESIGVAMPSVTDVSSEPPEKKPRYKIDANERQLKEFHFAAVNGNKARLQELLPIISVDSADPAGETALHKSAQMGHADIVTFLLAQGIGVNSTDHYGQTALHKACDINNPADTLAAVLVLLSKKNCFRNALDIYGRTPLYCLAGNFSLLSHTQLNTKNKAEIAWMLIKEGANPAIAVFDAELGIANMTALHKAVMRNQYKIVKAIFSSYLCPINAKNENNRTALHEAVILLNVEMVELLLLHPDIDLLIRDINQKMVLDIIDDKLAIDPDNSAATKIRQLIDLRMKRNVLKFLPRVNFVTSFNLFYGHRVKPPIQIEGDKELGSLRDKMNITGDGNVVIASLIFVIKRPDHVRSTVTINLQGIEFNVTKAWKSRIKIGSTTRSLDSLKRITDRIDQAPNEAKEHCVHEHQINKPLSSQGATALFNNDKSSPSFEKIYHHSETALLDFLEMPDTIDVISKQLTQRVEKGSKIYPTMVLMLNSKYYLCDNCALGIFGEQNPKQSKFLLAMRAKLQGLGYLLSSHYDLKLMVCMSATTPTSTPFKNVDDHQEIYVDCRVPYENAILQRTFEPEEEPIRFRSRRR